jgi:hypothetical protein
MAPSDRTKSPEIDELFKNFATILKLRIHDLENRSMNSTTAKSPLNFGDERMKTIPKLIWKKFVEHCEANDLDPAMQIRDAIACHYHELLRESRIRRKLAPRDDLNSA